jgi:hypothetical protein
MLDKHAVNGREYLVAGLILRLEDSFVSLNRHKGDRHSVPIYSLALSTSHF